MIGVKLNGRLGNQMFQYAFAYTQARKFRTLFFLDKTPPKPSDYQLDRYFTLRLADALQMRIARSLYWRLYRTKSDYSELLQTGDDAPADILSKSQRNVFWNGFFQSEVYFDKPKIKELFKIKKKYNKNFLIKYKQRFSEQKTIVLHIRRTDYLTYGSEELGGLDLSLPINYYTKCLALIPDLSQYTIYVIADDIDFARQNLQNLPNVYFEHNDEITDLQLLINADILIISNSTFAWWGAILNKKAHKQIFAPKYWLGFKVNREYPIGITSQEFITIDVYD
ncbi:alpha-1,2-fucosyltransferase [Eisenibacter elegans]|jgi:hypothetical protein|uniref:alpha-1,2-fucosyltransferase n=1 Tax=Eisenibacter elegans TaxID=997 RepID=UPI000406EE43|nr:alpha-1,2-fucosyltransferase [Eisenibacter elegans]